MSMDVNISNIQDSGISEEYNLTKENISAASIDNLAADDASKLLGALVKYVFVNAQGAYKKASSAQKIQQQVPLILQLSSNAFDSDEEKQAYEQYMKVLVDKVGNTPILTAIDKLSTDLKGPFAILGKLSKDGKTIHDKIKQNSITFEQLSSSPESFGYQYEVGAGKANPDIEENKKTTTLMNAVDKGESLFERQRVSEAIVIGENSVTLSITKYFQQLFLDYGFGNILAEGGSPFTVISSEDKLIGKDKVFAELSVVDYRDAMIIDNKKYLKGETHLVTIDGEVTREMKLDKTNQKLMEKASNEFKSALVGKLENEARQYLTNNAERLLAPYMKSQTSTGTKVDRQIQLGTITVTYKVDEKMAASKFGLYNNNKTLFTNKTPNQSKNSLIPFDIITNLNEKVILSEGVFPDMDDSRTIGGMKRGYASLRRMIS